MNNQIIKMDFNDDQVKLIKSQLAPNATDNELKLFLYQAKRTGLDPLTRQIYCIHRGGKMTIQTSIDGFRVIAERSGDYAGQSEPVFVEENNKLICAKVSVYRFRNDVRYEASVGVAYWSEYVQEYNGKPSTMWAKMPHTMLAKVAEALALRKAYPQDLSGLYTGDEMEQSDKTITEDFNDVPEPEELQELRKLVFNSTLNEEGKEAALVSIESCTSYKKYDQIKYRLEDLQKGFEHVANPSQKDINNHLKKLV